MTALETLDLETGESRRPIDSCTPVLETSRLSLRAPRFEDARQVAALANDRRIAAMTANIPHPYAEKDAENWIVRAWSQEPSPVMDRPFLITRMADGALLGATGYVLRERDDPEIGYWIAPAHWGQGFATEAARAVIDHVFDTVDAPAIQASARVVNPASRRVLEKCGFQWIGAGLARSVSTPGSLPIDRFRLERRVWSSLKAWRDAKVTREAVLVN